MKLSFLVLFYTLFSMTFCNPTPKMSGEKVYANDSLIKMTGIVVLSSLQMDYFFPTSEVIDRINFKHLDYNNGFLLMNLGAEARMALMKDADTSLDKFNHPITHILPVVIEYYEKDTNPNPDLKQLCIKLVDTVNCLKFDTKLRFIKEVTPIAGGKETK